MIVHLIVALLVTAFLFYVFCHSPLAKEFADEILHDPLQDSIRQEITKEEKKNGNTE